MALVKASVTNTTVADRLIAIPLDGGPPVTIDDGTTGPVTAQFDNTIFSVRSIADNQVLYLKGFSNSQVGFYVADLLPGQTQLLGDYNHNGVVDAADYTVWRDTLGSTTDLRANGDNSGASAGKIDQADYNIWKANFGAHGGNGSGAAAAVPEPASLWLLLCGTLMICSRRWQNGRKRIHV